MTRYLLFALLAAVMIAAGAWGCSDDDDDADAAPDVDVDGDVDGDADGDSDTDSDVDYNGTLSGTLWGYSVSVKTLLASDLTIGATLRWFAEGGPVNNVQVTEIRVYFPDDTDSEPFWTSPEDYEFATDPDFDGIVLVGPESDVGYTYQSQSRQGFDERCDEEFAVEVEATYGDDNTPLDTLVYTGTTLGTVNCIEE